MQYQKLELHLAQVERAIAHFRSKFSNQKKRQIYGDLIKLFEAVKSSSYKTLKPDDLNIAKIALDTVFYSIEHLDYKSDSEIPKRLIYCLNLVLNDWIDSGTENYFIVVSYNKTTDNFIIRARDEGSVKVLDQYFQNLFSVGYSQSLIQISKPRFLFDDYLSSIPVYHEMGHFIDKNYQIVKSLIRHPGFMPAVSGINREILGNHYAEHFADIFASQYIGRSSIEPLNYIAYGTMNRGNGTHPSNNRRIEVVNAFLSGTGAADVMQIVDNLKLITSIRSGRNLEIKNIDLDAQENPFEKLCALKIDKPQKLHSLYSQGWNNWLDETSKVRQKFPHHLKCCQVINNLIRDSIRLTMEENEKSSLKRAGNFLRSWVR